MKLPKNIKPIQSQNKLSLLLIIISCLILIKSNLIISINESSQIVAEQNKLTITIATISQVNQNLKITIDTVFSLVNNDGTPNDNISSPCYLSNLSVACQVSNQGSKYALLFNASIFQANQNYQVGILVVNPLYSDNFRLDAYAGSQSFITFGTIVILPKIIQCSVAMTSKKVRDKTDATFYLNITNTPPAGSQLFISVPVPQTLYGFPKMIATNPVCASGSSQTTYSCSLSQLFSQQILTINDIFPITQTNLSIKVSSLYNPPYNASWLELNIIINDNLGRQTKKCSLYQSPPQVLPTSLGYQQSGWDNLTGSSSTVLHTLNTYFTPLSTSSIMIIYRSALTLSVNPPALSITQSYNSSFTVIKISNITKTSNTFQVSTLIKNPLSTVPLGFQIYVLFNDTNFMEKYFYPSTSMVLETNSHTVNLFLSNNKTGFINKLNVSLQLGISGGLGSIGQSITAIITFQKGQIICDSGNNFTGLELQSNIPASIINSCINNKITVSSNGIVTLSNLWFIFNYKNHYSLAPNQVFTYINTISGYQVSSGGNNLNLTTYTCDISMTNTILQLGMTNNLQIRQNSISNLNLSGSRRVIKLYPPQNLKPLSLAIQVIKPVKLTNSNTTIVSYNIAVGSIQSQFRQGCNIDIQNVNNPIDFTIQSRQWTIQITDNNNYPSSSCIITTLPQYSSANLIANYSLINNTIQQNSVLNIIVQSVLKYQMNNSVIPIVQVYMNPASVLQTDTSICGIPGQNTTCSRVTSYVINSTFGGLQTNITLSIKNSPQPSNNTFVIKILNSVNGFVYQTNTIIYNLVPLQFQYTVAFTGLYLQVGQLQINITKKPNKPITLNYSEADVSKILTTPQCSLCGNQGDRIIISGTVQYFYRSNVRVFGIGSNGAVYAQSSIQVKYPCPWIGCRICQYQDVVDPLTNITVQGNLVCLKCFDVSLTRYSFLYQSQCYQNCPIGTFPATIKCEVCPQLCYSCTQQSCNECQPGYFVYQNNCLKDCPQDYVKNSTHCIPRKIICPQFCFNCPNDNICNECQTNYYLLNNKCYLQCPVGYVVDPFSNNIAQCAQFVPPQEAGFFPFIFLIVIIIWLLILGIFKCFQKRSLLLGNFVVFTSIMEWGPLLICIILAITKYDPYSRTNTPQLTLLNQALCFIIFFSKIMINFIFFIYFMKNIADDTQFTSWKQKSTANRNLYFITLVLSVIFSFQVLRLIYSRLFGLEIFFGRFNTSLIFKPVNYFTLGYFILVSICIYVFSGVAIYNEDGFKTTLFYASIQLIIVQTLLIIGSAMDAKCGKAEQFFQYQVYKIENMKQQIYADSYSTPGKKKGIDIYYQNESGGSLHEILRSDRKRNFIQRPSQVNGQWVQTNKIPRRCDILEQEQSASRLDTQQNYEQTQNKSSLFKWKIIKDWNKLKQSMPKSYNPRLISNMKTIEKNKFLSRSPDNKSRSTVRKSMKKVSSYQDLKNAEIINPLGFFLKNQQTGVIRAKCQIENGGKRYFYQINQNADRDKQINELDQSDQRDAQTAPQKVKREIGKIVNNSKIQQKEKSSHFQEQENISQIKEQNIFNKVDESGDENSLYQVQAQLIKNLKSDKNNQYQDDQLSQEQKQQNNQIQNINSQARMIEQQKKNQKQQKDDFQQVAKRRLKKIKQPKRHVNRQTEKQYLQRLVSSDAFQSKKKKRNVSKNKNQINKNRQERPQLQF